MGFLSRLFKKKSDKYSDPMSNTIKTIEDKTSDIVEDGVNKGLSEDEIIDQVEEFIDIVTENLGENIVAKLADDWTCDVCNTKNHKTDNCSQCGYEAGAWKCPKCGNIVIGSEFHGPQESPCTCGYDPLDEFR